MDIFLLIFYILLFATLIFTLPVFKGENISRRWLAGLFLVKCLLSAAYLYIHQHYYGGGDTMLFFRDGNVAFSTLPQEPLKYLHLTFGPNGGDIPEDLRKEITAMGYWGDVSMYTMSRFSAIARLFSFGNVYVHGIFMAFLSLLGLHLIYRTACRYLSAPPLWIKGAVFLIPSVLFWTAGVHKDGMSMLCLGIFFFSIDNILRLKKLPLYTILLLLSCIPLYMMRDFILLLLLPGLLAYGISKWLAKPPYLVFFATYLVLMIAGAFIPTQKGATYIELITQRQEDFRSLKGGRSDIDIASFDPNLLSMAEHLPQAFSNAMLGPFYLSPSNPMQLATVIETAGLIIFILLILWKSYPFKLSGSSFAAWWLLFALSYLALIGFIVPNVGAIVRYRSVALPFLLLGLLGLIQQNLKIK